MTLPEATISRLTGVAESLLGTTGDPTGVGASGVWQREAEEYLISALVSALGTTPGKAPNVGRKNRIASTPRQSVTSKTAGFTPCAIACAIPGNPGSP